MKFPREVYAIRHTVTNKIYIGSSANVQQRYAGHLSLLRRGNHPVEDFQQDYNEHGENLTLTILDTIENSAELEKEYAWMDAYETYKRPYGYNYKDVQYNPQSRLSRVAVSPYVVRRRELTDRIKELADRIFEIKHLELLVGLMESNTFYKSPQ